MRVLIIGNGFDLDLGFNTRYSDFAKSQEWIELFKSNERKNNLAELMYNHATINEWFDVEKCIKEYVQKKELKKDFDSIRVFEDKKFLKDLVYEFDKYITFEFSSTPVKEDSLAARLISANNDCSCFDSIYSFNFFEYDLLPIVTIGNVGSIENVQYVHGSGNNSILGIDEDGCKSYHYSFTKKIMYPYYPNTKIIPDLLEATEIVIFGHSLNSIDWKYFQLFFEKRSQIREGTETHITIITRDSDSKRQLKENLSGFGISLTALCSISNLEFIETVAYYRNEYEDGYIISELLRRLCNNS